jgi:DNA polymerase
MMDTTAMDALTALRLQIEWGADEALEAEAVNRLRPAPTRAPALAVAPHDSASESVAPARRAATPTGATTARVAPTERAINAAADATTLAGLRAAIAAFDGSALRDTATNLVFLEGDPACGLLFVGEAPNADADRTGSPFAGPVGAYLELMLRSIGLERSALCLAPLIPWRPPGDRPPSAAEVATCLPFLHRLITLVGPRRIVTLGPLPARALLGVTTLRRRTPPVWTDTAIPGVATKIPILPMPSAAILLRTTTQRRHAWADLRLLRHSLDANFTHT